MQATVSLEYPKYRASSVEFAKELGEFLRSGATLPWEEAAALISDATKLAAAEKTLERIEVPTGKYVNVVGDTHGQLFDLFNIFKDNGMPSPDNPYLFNGDFVDRGSFSVEVLLILLAWKVALPNDVRLSRGNHESHDMNVPYGFTGEVLTKYSPEAYMAFQQLFDVLPLAHVVNNDVLVVHGGLPREAGVCLEDIEQLDRVKASESHAEGNRENTTFTDLLWADPRNPPGIRRSERGGDVITFGPDVTKQFLEKNDLSLLIRSHEVKAKGYEWQHSEQCLTVFSAPCYADCGDNAGAVIRLHALEEVKQLRPEIRVFGAAQKPDFYVPALAYSPMSELARRYLSPDAKAVLSKLMGR